MTRYAGHEYYSELPFTPEFASETTSEILAGHVYYWDGWNAFVINYIDSDISPYNVVHIGEIADASISDYLTGADETIHIQVSE
ncbi:MAG: cyclophilin-like fold protein [Lachnospiraceae bacterium]|nr:cyclophilin-like fold protein [Lachnospiraceae bacterium]MDD3617210.1 cyclophilin-like fold protein [Lachnospiraceae bacterium]